MRFPTATGRAPASTGAQNAKRHDGLQSSYTPPSLRRSAKPYLAVFRRLRQAATL